MKHFWGGVHIIVKGKYKYRKLTTRDKNHQLHSKTGTPHKTYGRSGELQAVKGQCPLDIAPGQHTWI